MNVRPALVSETHLIRAIARRAYMRYVPRIGREPAPMRGDFLAHIENGEMVVAETSTGLAGLLAGFLAGYPRNRDYFIENIAVDPAFARKGVGNALMKHAETAAIGAGKTVVQLYTNVRMWENFSFYAALGYHRTREVREAGFRRVYFEKTLEHT
jgi:ribosomal protein S18 acetylase RimI-like enzyme